MTGPNAMRRWLAVCCAVFLSSCASTTDFDTGDGIRRVTSGAAAEPSPTIYFITTRCHETPRDTNIEAQIDGYSIDENLRIQCWEHSNNRLEANTFGLGTADGGSLQCGTAIVSAILVDQGPIALRDQDVRRSDCATGFSALQFAIAAIPCRCALIHIHGYNTTFEFALKRTAQLTADLQYTGIVILFSTASAGRLEDYVPDLEAGDLATPALTAVLEQLASPGDGATIHILAHSMGSKTAVNAIARSRNIRLGEVILAAPDIDRNAFLRALPRTMPKVKRLTVYTSRFDVAISGSTAVHRGRSRLGEGLSGSLLANQSSLDVIDATARASDPYAHSYFAESAEVLVDMRAVLSGQPATDRMRLDCDHSGVSGGNSCILKCPDNIECGPSLYARVIHWIVN